MFSGRRAHIRRGSSRLVLPSRTGIGVLGIRVHRCFRPRNQVTFIKSCKRSAFADDLALRVIARQIPVLARVVLHGWARRTTGDGLRAARQGLRAANHGLRNELLHRSGRHDGGHGRRCLGCQDGISECHGCAHNGRGGHGGSTRRTAMEPISETTGVAAGIGGRQDGQSQQNRNLPHFQKLHVGRPRVRAWWEVGRVLRRALVVAVVPLASNGGDANQRCATGPTLYAVKCTARSKGLATLQHGA